MSVAKIRMAMMATGLIVATTLLNLLVMQSTEGLRFDRHYRGLTGLPGTPSTTFPVPVPKPVVEKAAVTTSSTSTTETAAAPAAKPVAADPQSSLISAIQAELTRRGYSSGNANGTLGLVTRSDIMAFEHDRGLPLTAEPTPQLLAELKSEIALAPTNPARRRPAEAAASVIRTVQQSLAQLGYKPGAADGVMGEATSAAIRAFERDQKLASTGRVSGLLVSRLAAVGGSTISLATD